MPSRSRPPRSAFPACSLPGGVWDRLEEVLERFEAAWHRGERPCIDDFLTPAQPECGALLIELAHAELELRLKAGETARVEEYLRRYPELGQDPAVVLELAVAEYGLRCRAGEAVTVDEYLARFPAHAEALRQQPSLQPLSAAASLPRTEAAEAPTLAPTHPWADQREDPTQTGGARPPVTLGVPDTLRVPGYEVLGLLGKGGMGVVYQARHLALGRVVALKMILHAEHAGEEERRRFRSEAEAVARLQHPHVVQVFEVGEHQGLPFMALEYCPGGSLSDRLDGTPWPPAKAAALVETLARAVSAAHQAGLVHRDLKPANVLLSAEDQPKVSDFGLAKRMDARGMTQTGAVVGTPSYMAPEQASGDTRQIGPAADVYALGAILYELLTGRPPFKAATAMDTVLQVLAEEAVPIRRLQPKVPRDLETVCLKCLHKDAGKRYPSAEALAEDLHRYLAHEPVRARPTSAWERGWKWARRRPATAALAVLGVGAPLSLLILGLVYNARVQEARADVDRQQLEVERSRADAARQAEKARNAQARADQTLVHADGLRLSALSSLVLSDNPGLALLLAVEGAERGRPREAAHNSALLAALERNRELHTFPTPGWDCYTAALSADGGRLAVGAGMDLRVWDVSDPWHPRLVWKADPFPWHGFQPNVLSPDGRWVAKFHDDCLYKEYGNGSKILFTDRVIHLWDTAAGGKGWRLLAGHRDRVCAAVFSPDSRQLLTASWDGTARLWDLSTGKTSAVLNGGGNALATALFTPDGQGVLTVAHGDRRTSVPESKADVIDPPWYQDAAPQTGTFGPAIHFRDGVPDAGVFARLWDRASGRERVAFLWSEQRPPASALPLSAAFSGDGRRVAFGFETGRQRAGLWDTATGRRLRLFDFSEPAQRIALSQDGRRLLTASSVRWQVWDTEDGRRLGERRAGANWSWVALRPDGRQVAAAEGSVVGVWDSDTGEERFTLNGHDGAIHFLAYGRDGRRLATAGDSSARLWNVDPDPSPLPTLRLANARVLDAAFSPDGKRIVAGTTRKEAILWDPATDARTILMPRHKPGIFAMLNDVFGEVQKVAFSPDGRRVLTLARDEPARLSLRPTLGGLLSPRFVDVPHSPVRVWDAATGKLLAALEGHTDFVREARFSADGSRIVTLSEGREWPGRTLYMPLGERIGQQAVPRDVTARIWDTATGKELLVFRLSDPTGRMQAAALSPDGSRLFVAERSRQFLLDVATSRQLWSTSLGIPLTYAEFSTDGRWILAFNDFDYSGTIIPDRECLFYWDAATGKLANTSMEQTFLTAAHFRPGSHQAAWALNLGQWRLGDVERRNVLLTREAHARAVRQLEFSPDGRSFVTVSADRTTRVWDSDSGAELLALGDSGNAVLRAHFRPGAAEVLTVGQDGVVRLVPTDPLPLARARQPRVLSPQERERYGVRDVRAAPRGNGPD